MNGVIYGCGKIKRSIEMASGLKDFLLKVIRNYFASDKTLFKVNHSFGRNLGLLGIW
jgi:hypothetical protein